MQRPGPLDASVTIAPLLPRVLSHLRRHNTLVIEAPPGAGKTTRVPPALLALDERDIVVLEPRRLAARLAARFIARERGEPLGATVGYQVRFEEVAGPRTRLRFLTEGVLLRRLLSDPALGRVGTVILDEFHERHLEGDTALALLRRRNLRLVVMSATLDAAGIAAYLGGCAVLRSEGRQYPLDIEYTPHSAVPLDQQIAAALERLAPGGHVLVFLPGAAEIRRAMAACAPIARRKGLLLLSLHGDQPPEEQDRAVAPSERPKVILSTNVAESSVTIEGVTAVIDSGLARIASHSPWSGLPVLRVSRVSQASANQRAGRAGRTAPGRVIRLYPLEDFVRRPAHDVPEIARADLSPTALLLRAVGVSGFDALAWLDAPPAASVASAEELLRRLGAIDSAGKLTREGREMARYPLHPRLARLILESARRGVAEDGCAYAASLDASGQPERALRQIRRMVHPPRQKTHDERALHISILTAFSDRVARRRQGRELQLAAGGPAMLSPACEIDSEFQVAVEIEDRPDQKMPIVRLASPIEPEWLLDLFPERVRERSEVLWNRAAERVESASALLYEELVIEESRGAPDPDAAASLLAAKALEAGVGRFADSEELAAFLARVDFAASHGAIPRLGDGDIRAAIESLARGLRSFDELKTAAGKGLIRALERRAGPLEAIAPSRVILPNGRQVRVHYEAGKPPWIASRLQDFFGMHETPRIAGGQVPLVVHLLAPNQRPVQMTADLAGFWERLYPQVRRELMRRYPKHPWPEKPGDRRNVSRPGTD